MLVASLSCDKKSCNEERQFQLQLLEVFKSKIKNEGDFVHVALKCGYCVHEINNIILEYNKNYKDCMYYYVLWKFCLPKLLNGPKEIRNLILDVIKWL